MTTPQPAALPDLTAVIAWLENGCDPSEAVKELKHYQSKLRALAALQSQPAEVSDAEIDVVIKRCRIAGQYVFTDGLRAFARAILALRPQSESEAPTVEAAHEMGANGGPVVEAERLAFEAWMAGHCWAVSPTWNGETYDDSEGDKARKLLDPLARMTRMLWAAWRDRAALSSLRPQAVPMTCAWTEDDETGNYATTCGHVFALNDGGPADNGMKFCCYCGGGITAQGAHGGEAK